jgi:Family of unknown function (DUF5677)
MLASAPHEEWDLSVRATTRRLKALEKNINSRRIFPRALDLYPFDTVAGEMLGKAFAICRAALVLIKNGFPDEAFSLCRSLYECSTYLRYITCDIEKRDERSRKFLEFGVTSKAFWYSLLDKSSTLTDSEREDAARYKDENQIPDDPRTMFAPWSGERKLGEKVSAAQHPIDADDSTATTRENHRALAFTDTSCYVHCTQPGLNTFSHEWRAPFQIVRSYAPSTNTPEKVCMVIQVTLPEIVRYCLYGMDVEALENLKPRRHSPSHQGK